MGCSVWVQGTPHAQVVPLLVYCLFHQESLSLPPHIPHTYTASGVGGAGGQAVKMQAAAVCAHHRQGRPIYVPAFCLYLNAHGSPLRHIKQQ